MTPQATIQIDTADFNRQLERYYRLSTSTVPDILNRRLFFSVLRALPKTPTATKADVRKAMNEDVMAKRQGRPGGMVKLRYALTQKGRSPGLYGKEMHEAASAFVKSRLKGLSYLKSGWLPALAMLGKRFQKGIDYIAAKAKLKGQQGYFARKIDSGRYNPNIGWAIPAVVSNNSFATACNTVSVNGVAAARTMAIADQALREGLEAEKAEMMKEIERRLLAAANAR